MISQETAIETAKQIALNQGWTWLEPIKAVISKKWIIFGSRFWKVTSNAEGHGTNCVVTIDAQSGKIIDQAFLPR